MPKTSIIENRLRQVELGEVCQKISVGLAISVTPYMREEGTQLIRNQNIKPNYFDDSSIVYVDNDFARSQKSKQVHAGDVISVRTGVNIGDTCVVPDSFDGALTFTTLIARPNQDLLDSRYLSQYMNSELGRSEVNRLMAGGGKANLNAGELKKYLVSLPSLEEQREIAETLVTWDEAIALTERAIKSKQKCKRGFLQKIFSSESYKPFELGGFVDLRREKFNPSQEDDRVCIELEHLSQETGQLVGSTRSSNQNSIKNVFKPGDVLFGKLRPYLQKFANPNFEGVCSTEIWALKVNLSLCTSRYLFYLVQTHEFASIANKTSGSKMPRADWGLVSGHPFPLPSLTEQKKITNFLDSLSDEIMLLQSLKEKLELQKRGLMQKLLSGKWPIAVQEAA